jgi:chromosome segregation ATPase
VQRNYESLSAAYEARASEAEDARRKLADEEHRGGQLAAQLETALNRVASLELKLKQAAERDAAGAAARATQEKGAFDAALAVERVKALSAKAKESERRLKEMEVEVSTSRARADDSRRRETAAGDDKRRVEKQLGALEVETSGVESELKAARDALIAASAEAMVLNRSHAVLQGQVGRLKSEVEMATNEARRERARGDSEFSRADGEARRGGEAVQRLAAVEREAVQLRGAAAALSMQRRGFGRIERGAPALFTSTDWTINKAQCCRVVSGDPARAPCT